MGSLGRPTLTRDDYTVAWICVLPCEMLAARILLDERHEPLSTPYDQITHTLGSMGQHNVVIARATAQGRGSAANVVTHLIHSFPKVRFGLMVGIGGGATTAPHHYGGITDVRLGDVVVSVPQGDHGGILAYDFGKQYDNGFKMNAHLNKPAQILISASGSLQVEHDMQEGYMNTFIETAIDKLQRLGNPQFQFPGRKNDQLFLPDYRHEEGRESCAECDPSQTVRRDPRERASVHYGLIASADRVMMSASVRDRMRQKHKVLCFEMEAAGLMNNFPCIAIRGISDYADGHKNDQWQPYASITAAAYTKDLLRIIQPETVHGTELAAVLLHLKENINYIRVKKDAKRRIKILDWLTPLEFSEKQRTLFQETFPVGQWLLESDEFTRWVDGARWRLRCYGGMGTGKTHLCAVILNHLEQTFRSRPVICVYLDAERQTEQTPRNVMGSLLRQLIQFDTSHEIPQRLQQLYDSQEEGALVPPSIPIMQEVFDDLLRKYDRTYLIIDGMDEGSKEASQIVKEYPMKLNKEDFNISLLTTSLGQKRNKNVINCSLCPSEDVSMYFHCSCEDSSFDVCWKCHKAGKRCPKGHEGTEYNEVEVEMRASDEDIQAYCRHRLRPAIKSSEDVDIRLNPDQSSSIDKLELLERISLALPRYAQGKFVVARCWIDDMLANDIQAGTEESLIHNFEAIPYDSLAPYVRRKLQSIESHLISGTFRVAQETLSFVFAVYPKQLTFKALSHALAMNQNTGLIEASTLATVTDVLRACRGLVSINKGSEDHSFVMFFHTSIHKILDRMDHEIIRNANKMMASICLATITHPDTAEYLDNVTQYPFFPYALEHWGDHVRRACTKPGGEAFQFIKGRHNILALAHTIEQVGLKSLAVWIHEDVHSLHICAWFGLSSFIKSLSHEGDDINIRERRYDRTPLQYACVQGQVDSVHQLLELNAHVDDSSIIDTLSSVVPHADLSFKNKILEILKILLDTKRADINARVGDAGGTALMVACKSPFLPGIRRLLQEDSLEIDIQGANGRTAMCQIVCALSRQGSTINELESRYEAISLLLQHGANPNLTDNAGHSPVHWAVLKGQYKAVEIMLKHSRIAVQMSNKLLHFASAGPQPDLILLLHCELSKHPGYNVNLPDEEGSTPLHHACQSRSPLRRDVITALLSLGADPNIFDRYGFTPYMIALLLHGPKNTNSWFSSHTSLEELSSSVTTHTKQSLPALTLSHHQLWPIVNEIIPSGRADLRDHETIYGLTLLHKAASAGRPDIIESLLSARVLDPNTQNKYGRTPLHQARSVSVAQALIQHGAAINRFDLSQATPLAAALRNKNPQVADYLASVGGHVGEDQQQRRHLLAAATKIGAHKAVEALCRPHSGGPVAHKQQRVLLHRFLLHPLPLLPRSTRLAVSIFSLSLILICVFPVILFY